jgi:hypothetical protein
VSVAPTSIDPGRGRHRFGWVVVALLAAALLGGLTVALLYELDVLGGASGSTVAGSTTEGSGVSRTLVRVVPPFTGVDLAGGNNVVIRVGEKQSVVVRGDDNLLDRVTTEVRSGTLVIANTPGSFTTRSPMVVEVGVPTLGALALDGSGNIAVEGIDAERLTVTLPGSGTITGSGTAKALDVTVGGSGVVRLTQLVADEARAVVSGSGSIFVTATQALDAAVSGSGVISYAGGPQDVTTSVTGSGAVVASG